MAILIRRRKVTQISELEEIIVDAPTLADAMRILKSTKEEDISTTFRYKSSVIGKPELKSSFIDVDECEKIPN